MTWLPALVSVASLVSLVLAVQDGNRHASTRELADRVVSYVREYEQQLPSIVGEEVYRQSLRESRGGRALHSDGRVLKSLVSWVRLPHVGKTTPLREVFERDGNPAPQSRGLRQLLEGPIEELETKLRELMDQSSAHNLAAGTRNINLPTFPLAYIESSSLEGGRWSDGGRDRGVAILEFHERKRPTMVRSDAGQHLRARVRFWVDETSGRIHRTELRIGGRKGGSGPGRGSGRAGADVSYRADVTFAREERLGLWLPRAMSDLYEYFVGTRRLVVEGHATYSAYRRFETIGRVLPAAR
jgi:hypothetical protein